MVGETWSREEDKAFENALAIHHETSGDLWEKIAASVPGKSMEEINKHYELLVEDVQNIDSGRVPSPGYTSPSSSSSSFLVEGCVKSSRLDHERRKGIAWTEEEHRLFLLGLEKYGKGDWRSISRNFVISRTPTQVASHAQKYFIRLNSINRDRRRSSIHDITRVENADLLTSQAPVTGKVINFSPVVAGKAAVCAPGIAIGRPLGGPAVGYGIAGPVQFGPAIAQPMGGSLSKS